MSEPAANASTPADGFEWAIVEIFGHRRRAGKIREEERFGAKFLRIDIPTDGDPEKGYTSEIYGAASIFSVSFSDEATVMRANAPYRPVYRLAAPVEIEPESQNEADNAFEPDTSFDDPAPDEDDGETLP